MSRAARWSALLALALAVAPALAKRQILKKLDQQSYASFTREHGAHLDVRVAKPGELIAALKIYTGKFNDASFSTRRLGIVKESAVRARVPFERLSPSFQKSFVKKMWPRDGINGGYWAHRVTYAGHETLWTIAQIFTGSGRNYRAIMKASGRRSDKISKGARLKIPAKLLRPILRGAERIEVGEPEEPVFAAQTKLEEVAVVDRAAPEPLVSSPAREREAEPPPAKPPEKAGKPAKQTAAKQREPGPKTAAKQPQTRVSQALAELKKARRGLRYGRDGKGRYAVYRLRAGEAIYSSVVIRFCGLIRADDVNRVARLVIERSGIKDETDLPVGAAIRIPYEYLEPEYRTEDDPEYIAYIRNLEDVAQVSTEVVSRNLEGVHIILDAGHGGRDPGARFGWVWEDDFVYDIVCRVKKRLESESAATVYATVYDPSVKYKVQDVARFSRDQDEVLLTSPRYRLSGSRVATDGVNLRWVYANHQYHKLTARGVKPENILFASIHADSLHRGIRGGMVYIPDAGIVPGEVKAPSKFRKYREYKGASFTARRKERLRGQALSASFAKNMVDRMRAKDVRVHRQKPIRSRIYRNPKRPFVPAVLKYNRIPTRCLIEVCNLNNSRDRELIKKSQFRQNVADAFVEAVYQTYGVPRGGELSYTPNASAREPN